MYFLQTSLIEPSAKEELRVKSNGKWTCNEKSSTSQKQFCIGKFSLVYINFTF